MQPSGKPHLGNYLGAMHQHIALQDEADCFYFIANYHALTTVRDGEKLRKMSYELALDYLALGLDPNKATFFLQSDVPEVTELTWILSTITNIGLIERAHAWKDALQKGKKNPSVGLFIYPILMAVDILIYSPDSVPVGQDQKQHVEIAADIAGTFNHLYGETFSIPAVDIREDVAVVPGTDGQKMSKSYNNTIEIFAPADELKKQVFSVKTDSADIRESKDPAECIPFQLYRQFASKEKTAEMESGLREGGLGYGTIKTQLFEELLDFFAEARARRLELEKQPDYVREVLKKGGEKARLIAQAKLDEVRTKVGLS